MLEARQFAISRELLEKGRVRQPFRRTGVAPRDCGLPFERTERRIEADGASARICAQRGLLPRARANARCRRKESRCASRPRPGSSGRAGSGRDLLAEDGFPEKGRPCRRRPRSPRSRREVAAAGAIDTSSAGRAAGIERSDGTGAAVTRGFATPLARIAAVWVAEGLIPAAHANPEQTRRALETAVSLGAHSPEVTASLADLKASCAIRADATLLLPAATGLVIRSARRYCPPAFQVASFRFARGCA